MWDRCEDWVGWEVVSSLRLASVSHELAQRLYASAKYKFKTTAGSKNDRWDDATAVGSKHGRWACLLDRRIEARSLASLHDHYADARACSGLQQPLCGCTIRCQHNGWMMTIQVLNFVTETEMLSNHTNWNSSQKRITHF